MAARQVNAEVDLRWYWSSGPETWAGDAGLHSPTGGQLSALEAGLVRASYTDLSKIEDDQIRRATYVARARDIELRLSQLSARAVALLKADITGRGLPFSVSSAAVYTEQAKVMCATDRRPAHEKLREALMACKRADHPKVKALVFEVQLALQDARDAYEGTRIKRTRRLPDVHERRR
jgi:hypothetical protein